MMNKLNEMELYKVAGGEDYGFKVPVVGLPDSPRTEFTTDQFGGKNSCTGDVEISETAGSFIAGMVDNIASRKKRVGRFQR